MPASYPTVGASASTQSSPTSSPPIPTPAPSESPSPLKEPEGAAILNIGLPGAGKTRAIVTLLQAGLEVFVVGTEARFTETLLDTVAELKQPIERLHWQLIEPMKASWTAMIESANLINTLSYESLTQIKSGIRKGDYHQFITLLKALANFRCDRTGESYGPVDSWGSDRALVIDGLSGVNTMAMDLVVGSKPVKAQGEWGVAMDNEERLFMKLCSDTKCFFVLNAHVEREKDEVTGGTSVQVAALGTKLAPRFPRFFSEVVLSHRIGNEYWWSTATPFYTLKRRFLPLSEKIEPTYVPLVNAWRKRIATAQGV